MAAVWRDSLFSLSIWSYAYLAYDSLAPLRKKEIIRNNLTQDYEQELKLYEVNTQNLLTLLVRFCMSHDLIPRWASQSKFREWKIKDEEREKKLVITQSKARVANVKFDGAVDNKDLLEGRLQVE